MMTNRLNVESEVWCIFFTGHSKSPSSQRSTGTIQRIREGLNECCLQRLKLFPQATNFNENASLAN